MTGDKSEDRALPLEPKPTREEMLQRLRDFRARMPADYKFDREDANARGTLETD